MTAGISMFGRSVKVTLGGQSLLGVVSKDFNFGNEFEETTDDNSNGYQEFAAEPASRSHTFSLTGTVKNLELLRAIHGAGSQIYAATILFEDDGSTIAANYCFNELQIGGESNGKYEYTANFTRSGPPTFTPGTGG